MKARLVIAAAALAVSGSTLSQEIKDPGLRFCVELGNRVEYYAKQREIGHPALPQFQAAVANKRLSQQELVEEISAIHYAYGNYHGVTAPPAPAYAGIIAQDICMRAYLSKRPN